MQLNVEFFFRLLYECVTGSCYQGLTAAGVTEWVTRLWLWIISVGYLLSVLGIFIIVYVMVRLFELRAREQEFYGTIIQTPGATEQRNARWQHIESLINSDSASGWREAIVEADILLDAALMQKGYVGDGVGEKLKSVDPADLKTLQDAWEAHKVRNQIAHQGSAFEVTETHARRTIARYESVFRELGAI